jgi:hypothetical protein
MSYILQHFMRDTVDLLFAVSLLFIFSVSPSIAADCGEIPCPSSVSSEALDTALGNRVQLEASRPSTTLNANASVTRSANSVAVALWQLEKGSLKDQLTAWADRADWQIVWSFPDDLVVEAAVQFYGTFDDVVESVVQSYYAHGAPVRAHVAEANLVIYITEG